MKNFYKVILFASLFFNATLFGQPTIIANPDEASIITATPQTVYPNVVANDSILPSGEYLNNNEVYLSQVAASNPALQLQPDGSVILSSAVPDGVYWLDYMICLVDVPVICATGRFTLFVNTCHVDAPSLYVNQPSDCSDPTLVNVYGLPAGNWILRKKKDNVVINDIAGSGGFTTLSFTESGNYSISVLDDGNGCVSAETLVSISAGCNLIFNHYGNYLDSNGNGLVDSGDVINYQIILHNLSDTPVTDITMTSSDMNISGGPLDVLVAYNTSTFTGVHPITQADIDMGYVISYATAFGTWNGEPVSYTDYHYKQLPLVQGFKFSAFFDANNNAVRDIGEPDFPHAQFIVEKNSTGILQFYHNNPAIVYENNPAELYNVIMNIDPDYASYYLVPNNTFSNINISGNALSTYEFAVNAVTPYQDVAVTLMALDVPIPGFNYSYYIAYQNNSFLNVPSGTINFTKDSALSITNASEPTTPMPNGFTYNFTNLPAFTSRGFYISTLVPTLPQVALGQQLISSATITAPGTDILLSNNSSVLNSTIVGSYDPNDKTEHYNGKIQYDTFTGDDWLTYTIRFENTGTANALNVKVTDALDQKLDETSVKMVAASAAYSLQRSQNSLTWRMDGINLPPSVAGTQIGHGYLVFQVKPKPGYAIGDIIPNSANIYFDFNPAIVTNTFETEFVETLKVDDFEDSRLGFYPNPVRDVLRVESNNQPIENISIVDLLGKTLIKTTVNANQAAVDLSALSQGIYLATVKTANQQQTFKIFKQ